MTAKLGDLLRLAGHPGYAIDADALDARIRVLERRESEYDCRMCGRVAEMSGSHCPIGDPCQRCQLERAERRVAELEAERTTILEIHDDLASRVFDLEAEAHELESRHDVLEWLTVRTQRDRYRGALERIAAENRVISAWPLCEMAKEALDGDTNG